MISVGTRLRSCSAVKFWCSGPIRWLASDNAVNNCQLLVVGGGSGGLGAAALLGRRFNTTVVEPSDQHYYQPLFTLVGCGLKQLEECTQPMKKVNYIKSLRTKYYFIMNYIKYILMIIQYNTYDYTIHLYRSGFNRKQHTTILLSV